MTILTPTSVSVETLEVVETGSVATTRSITVI
jgi:hypothetical protein